MVIMANTLQPQIMSNVQLCVVRLNNIAPVGLDKTAFPA